MGDSDMSGGMGTSADGGAPPLLRVTSPERSPRVTYDDDDDSRVAGGASPHGRHIFARGPSKISYQPDALRISQAAQALVSRLIGTTTSIEALQVMVHLKINRIGY